MRKKSFFQLIILCVGVAAVLLAFSTEDQAEAGGNKDTMIKPKRIVLVLVDGLGVGQVQAARTSNGGSLQLDKFKTIGFHQPQSAVGYTPDAFAAATQLACGESTKNGYAGVNTQGQPLENIFDVAKKSGLGGAFISTANLTDPTPAAFLTHNVQGSDRYIIAQNLPESSVDFLCGGGRFYFGNRPDENDIINWFNVKGFKYHSHLKNNPKRLRGDKVVAITHEYTVPSAEAGREDYLQNAWLSGFHHYAKKGEGYFMVIHNSQVDAACRIHGAESVIKEVLDIDKTLESILSFSQSSAGTLVVVTGTYESGGMTVMESDANGQPFVKWAAKTSTSNLVPVYAYGAGSELFAGTYKSVDLFSKMKELLVQ